MARDSSLDIRSLGLALGVLKGLCLLFLGLIAWGPGWSFAIVELIGQLYIGYTPTLVGSIIGGVYGLIDGFIAGALLAWLYNQFQNRL